MTYSRTGMRGLRRGVGEDWSDFDIDTDIDLDDLLRDESNLTGLGAKIPDAPPPQAPIVDHVFSIHHVSGRQSIGTIRVHSDFLRPFARGMSLQYPGSVAAVRLSNGYVVRYRSGSQVS